MKKLKFIGALSFGIILTACQKENIEPNVSQNNPDKTSINHVKNDDAIVTVVPGTFIGDGYEDGVYYFDCVPSSGICCIKITYVNDPSKNAIEFPDGTVLSGEITGNEVIEGEGETINRWFYEVL